MTDIVIFKGSGQYSAMEYFADKLYEAFIDKNISAKLLSIVDGEVVNALNFIKSENPILTIGFNTMGLSVGGVHHYDLLNVSHLAILVDHPAYHIPALNLKSKNLYVSCVDEDRVNYLNRYYNFESTFLLYHGADKKIEYKDKEKDTDVVFLGSINDFNQIRNGWCKKYDGVIKRVLDTAIEIGIYNAIMPLDHILQYAFMYNGIELDDNEKKKYFGILIIELEAYLRNYHRYYFLKQIKTNNVVIYGNGCWDKYFSSYKNFKLRPPVSMEESIKIMQHAKITLNCTSSGMYRGSHERMLDAAMAGSLVVSNFSPFFNESFRDSIIKLNEIDFSKLDEYIDSILSNDTIRVEKTNKARHIAEENHTWNNRVQQIMSLINL